jgi:hypothetical protein
MLEFGSRANRRAELGNYFHCTTKFDLFLDLEMKFVHFGTLYRKLFMERFN